MPELRKDPVTGYWVILSPDRSPHPDDLLPASQDGLSKSPATCPLCPGNEAHAPPEVYAHRPGDGPAAHPNAPGWHLRVVPHKFPALVIEGALEPAGAGVYDHMNGIGAHEVLVETPDHGRQLSVLSDREIEQVLWAYRHRILDLKRDARFRYIAVFKTHGQRAGATLSHSHSQLLALPVLPKGVTDEIEGALRYHAYRQRCVFCDLVRQEIQGRERLIYENSAFLVFAPYASRVPFETWIVPKQHRPSFEDGSAPEYQALAGALRVALRKLYLALDDPCYSFLLHNAPFADRPQFLPSVSHGPYQDRWDFYHWHIEILPTIGRGLGAEWGLGCYINPTPPEEAAHYLRELEV